MAAPVMGTAGELVQANHEKRLFAGRGGADDATVLQNVKPIHDASFLPPYCGRGGAADRDVKRFGGVMPG